MTIGLLAGGACAAPGAHGPDGEHLAQAGYSHAVAANAPRLETHSDAFELVAVLTEDELSILIDRYATNEPLLGATVEIESGGKKAIAKFHADHGGYAVADERFLQALRAPGEHALVITVIAGNESDLLDGVLRVDAAAPADHGHGLSASARWGMGAAVLTAAGLAALAWRRRQRVIASGVSA